MGKPTGFIDYARQAAPDRPAATRIADFEFIHGCLDAPARMQQAARCSDHTAFMYLGELIEFSDTDTLFTKPHQKQTEDYITGRYG